MVPQSAESTRGILVLSWPVVCRRICLAVHTLLQVIIVGIIVELRKDVAPRLANNDTHVVLRVGQDSPIVVQRWFVGWWWWWVGTSFLLVD